MSLGGGYTFSQVPKAEIPRSVFNRSHGHKTTFDSGFLIPFFVDEALPGDTFNVRASLFARLATPIAPFMDNLTMDVFWFAVPNRLLWENWQRFMGEQDNPGDSTDFLVPQVESGPTGFGIGTVFDYFGCPVEKPVSVSALFPRAYNLIFNEWFRDENLVDRVPKNVGNGPDAASDYALLRRGKRHDYFTSCLPWPQKGPGVELPIGTTAPVVPASLGAMPTFYAYDPAKSWRLGVDVGAPLPTSDAVNAPIVGQGPVSGDGTGPQIRDVAWAESGLVADLGSAMSVTINNLRTAFQIQRLLERDARGGTRYVEILKSHFGVTSPDSRLQRPEFLGGGSIPVTVNPVVQTSGSPPDTGGYTTTPQGNLAAYGTVAGSNIGFSKSFVEHCVVMGIMMVRADLSYQQGLPRMFSRRTRFDFYWPAFAHLGEQAVLNKEIYYQNLPGSLPGQDDAVFGYQERFAEYRYFPSKITGKYRSAPTGATWQSLDYWHLAQNFLSLPVLSDTFIEERPPVDRVVAVTTEPQFLFDSHIHLKCARPMPTYGVPGMIDHF